MFNPLASFQTYFDRSPGALYGSRVTIFAFINAFALASTLPCSHSVIRIISAVVAGPSAIIRTSCAVLLAGCIGLMSFLASLSNTSFKRTAAPPLNSGVKPQNGRHSSCEPNRFPQQSHRTGHQRRRHQYRNQSAVRLCLVSPMRSAYAVSGAPQRLHGTT
jgi:hypothetical protein